MRALVVTAVLLSSSSALPCSESGPPTLEDMELSIARDAVVPTNFVVFGGFDGVADGSTWWLQRADDEPTLMLMTIENERRRTRLSPDVVVEADTAYRLQWSPNNEPPVFSSVVVGFTTSSGPDDVAPASPVVTAETYHEYSAYNVFNDCGGGSTGTAVSIDVDDEAVDDDVGSFELRNAAGDVVEVDFRPFLPSDARLSVLEQKGGREEYALVAIDHAGNESEPTLIPADLGCEGSCSAGDGVVPGSATLLLLLRRRRRSFKGHVSPGVER